MAPVVSSWHPVGVYGISKQSYINAIKTGSDFSFNVHSMFSLHVLNLMVGCERPQLQHTGLSRAQE